MCWCHFSANLCKRALDVSPAVILQCLIFHCRPLSRRSPARPASLSWLVRVTVPGAFLRPAGGSCCVEILNSSVYVYNANLQLQQSHTSVTGGVGNDVIVLPRIAHVVAVEATRNADILTINAHAL